jgi:hypothetical protein
MKKEAIHIKKAREGLLHSNLGVAKDKPLPTSKVLAAAHSKNKKVARRAQFDINMNHLS